MARTIGRSGDRVNSNYIKSMFFKQLGFDARIHANSGLTPESSERCPVAVKLPRGETGNR